MRIKKYHIYTADLNPQFGAEPGKVRPVVVVQTDLLNNIHPSTVICPITTNILKSVSTLRVNVSGSKTGLAKKSAIIVDQIRALDNRRFIKEIGKLPIKFQNKLQENLKIILFDEIN
jgi:mRNA interferase MazF